MALNRLAQLNNRAGWKRYLESQPPNMRKLTNWLTAHACERLVDHNLYEDEIDFIRDYGSIIRPSGGIKIYHMLKKSMPPDIPANHRYQRLIGAVVVEGENGQIITAYRNRKAFSNNKWKTK